jgi:hypothetical protein
VMEACVAAGLVDGATARPAATYPRDLLRGTASNPYLRDHLFLDEGWDTPGRWIVAQPATQD